MRNGKDWETEMSDTEPREPDHIDFRTIQDVERHSTQKFVTTMGFHPIRNPDTSRSPRFLVDITPNPDSIRVQCGTVKSTNGYHDAKMPFIPSPFEPLEKRQGLGTNAHFSIKQSPDHDAPPPGTEQKENSPHQY